MENAGVGIAKIGRSPIRVLLIEDSLEDAELIIRRLEKGGYEVDFERVESEPAAKAALDRDWDLILCDHTLPHFSGYNALTIWKSKRCTAPFIFISGTLGEQAAVEALKAGCKRLSAERQPDAIDPRHRACPARNQRARGTGTRACTQRKE